MLSIRAIVELLLLAVSIGGVDVTHSLTVSTGKTSSSTSTQYYKYFAIGSNMVPSTMTSLRNLSPLSATAAILPHYELLFNIPGNPFMEPSAASVQKQTKITTSPNDIHPTGSNCVHGVLYTLTEHDFATLGRSEGVPLAYVWERCYPIPYIGNNDNAGQEALLLHQQQQQQQQQKVSQDLLEEAFVLTANTLFTTTASNPKRTNIPPSRSYLQILQEGSQYWKMDQNYQMYLQNDIPTNPIVPGISKQLLQLAERMNPKPMIVVPSSRVSELERERTS